MKRLVVISDLHCGHRTGLTPDDAEIDCQDSALDEQLKCSVLRRKMWNWYKETIESLQPIDVLLVNGDAVDGKGDKSGGTELILSDPDDQVVIAAKCITEARAKKIVLSYGTAYHTGRDTDWEKTLAREVGGEVHDHPFLNVGGVTFDCKHKVSSSIIPHGRNTGPARDRLWNILWSIRKLQPMADVVIRSHVHYFTYSGDATSLIITTPALQGPGTKFGARLMTGTIDIGILSFDCEDGEYAWRYDLHDMEYTKEKLIEC